MMKKTYTGRIQTRTYASDPTEAYCYAEIGPLNDKGDLSFGESAEVRFDRSFSTNEFAATVSMGSIQPHDPTMGRRRLTSYELVIRVAEEINALVAEGSTGPEIAKAFEVIIHQKAAVMGLRFV